MAKHTVTEVAETEDPQAVLTFTGKDGSDVVITVTITAEGDLRQVWDDLADLSEREALHYVSGQIFSDMTRSA